MVESSPSFMETQSPTVRRGLNGRSLGQKAGTFAGASSVRTLPADDER
jgi:hypothetical protein